MGKLLESKLQNDTNYTVLDSPKLRWWWLNNLSISLLQVENPLRDPVLVSGLFRSEEESQCLAGRNLYNDNEKFMIMGGDGVTIKMRQTDTESTKVIKISSYGKILEANWQGIAAMTSRRQDLWLRKICFSYCVGGMELHFTII